jgi:hypothetical protein
MIEVTFFRAFNVADIRRNDLTKCYTRTGYLAGVMLFYIFNAMKLLVKWEPLESENHEDK